MNAQDLLNELLAELPPKPECLKVDAYLDGTSFRLCSYVGPMEREQRSELTVDLQEPDSLTKASDWLHNLIADLIY